MKSNVILHHSKGPIRNVNRSSGGDSNSFLPECPHYVCLRGLVSVSSLRCAHWPQILGNFKKKNKFAKVFINKAYYKQATREVKVSTSIATT